MILLVAATGIILNIYAAPHKTVNKIFNIEMPKVIKNADDTCRIELTECISESPPGQPLLPMYGTSFEIPSGYEVEDVTLIRVALQSIALTSPIEWSQPAYRPGDQPVYVDADLQIYQSDEVYPAADALIWRTDPTEGKTLLSVSFSPLQYYPAANQLLYSTGITLSISLSEAKANIVAPIQKLTTTPSPLNPASFSNAFVSSIVAAPPTQAATKARSSCIF